MKNDKNIVVYLISDFLKKQSYYICTAFNHVVFLLKVYKVISSTYSYLT